MNTCAWPTMVCRAKDKSFNATLETHFDDSIGKVNVMASGYGQGDPQPDHQCLLCSSEKKLEQLRRMTPMNQR